MTFAIASELGLSPKLVFLFDPEDDEYQGEEGAAIPVVPIQMRIGEPCVPLRERSIFDGYGMTCQNLGGSQR
jgi:hypothetical protein